MRVLVKERSLILLGNYYRQHLRLGKIAAPPGRDEEKEDSDMSYCLNS